jgi:hypothetical protein
MAEICTVSLHSSYTAENLHIIHNETNGMRKLYHPFRMTMLLGMTDRTARATEERILRSAQDDNASGMMGRRQEQKQGKFPW